MIYSTKQGLAFRKSWAISPTALVTPAVSRWLTRAWTVRLSRSPSRLSSFLAVGILPTKKLVWFPKAILGLVSPIVFVSQGYGWSVCFQKYLSQWHLPTLLKIHFQVLPSGGWLSSLWRLGLNSGEHDVWGCWVAARTLGRFGGVSGRLGCFNKKSWVSWFTIPTLKPLVSILR